jgi:peptide/nickel transport system ATP-binding protein
MPEDAVISLDTVRKSFHGHDGRRFDALKGVNLEVGSSRLGVIGESGSGKSTLGRIMAGLDTVDSGQVLFNGRPIREVLAGRQSREEFRRAVQFVGQDTTGSFDPRRTIGDALRAPVERLHGLTRSAAEERALTVFALLGLREDMLSRKPAHLSGGQRQRIALARSMVVRPRILICDEVVSALDVSVQGGVLNAIKDYCETSGSTLVFISHGLPATAFVAEDVIVMYRGEIVESGNAEATFRDPVHPYTASLLEAALGSIGTTTSLGAAS